MYYYYYYNKSCFLKINNKPDWIVISMEVIAGTIVLTTVERLSLSNNMIQAKKNHNGSGLLECQHKKQTKLPFRFRGDQSKDSSPSWETIPWAASILFASLSQFIFMRVCNTMSGQSPSLLLSAFVPCTRAIQHHKCGKHTHKLS